MNDHVFPDARDALQRDDRGSVPTDVSRQGLFGNTETPPSLFVLPFLYLLLPTIIVLFRFQNWRLAAPVLVAAVAAIYWMVQYARSEASGPFWPAWRTWPFLLLAAVAAWMIGVVPPFAQNGDWSKHYALFNTLVDQPWPPAVPTEQGFGTLRYSLGYYVVPSLVAKYAGMQTLGATIWAWTTLGLYGVLTLAFGARDLALPARFFLAGVFLLFSGADIVGTGILHTAPGALMHFEWWAGFGEFSSNMTSILWTPQHALSAWIATFLIVRYPRRSVQAGGALCAGVAIWSPFSAIGIAPLMVWAIWRVGPRYLLTWMNFLVAPVLLVASAIFLTKGAAGIPATFLWSHADFSVGIWLLFVVLEFGAIAASLILVTPRHTALIIVASLSLASLALTSVGAYSDLMMRGSLPALAILAALSAMAVVTASNTWRKVPLLVCLAFGLVTPMGEIMRGVVSVRYPDTTQYRLMEIIWGSGANLLTQYVVPGYAGPIRRTPVASLADTPLSHYGAADFDDARHRIASVDFNDAALVTPQLKLPAGLYEIEAVATWDLTAAPGSDHAAHISLHGQRMLFPINTSHAEDRKILVYFLSKGEPVTISFGLGGWGKGKGFIEFKQLKINRISYE